MILSAAIFRIYEALGRFYYYFVKHFSTIFFRSYEYFYGINVVNYLFTIFLAKSKGFVPVKGAFNVRSS